jgi:hypothetical protein
VDFQNAADRDAAWFLREVVLKLDAYSLSQIAKATGYRSRPARGFAPPLALRIRGIGRHSTPLLNRSCVSDSSIEHPFGYMWQENEGGY